MIALPSIAFGGFSGSAKGVTARQVGGRSILSLKCFPTGVATSAQVARRASMSKITKSWKTLTEAQMLGWDHLAEHTRRRHHRRGKVALGYGLRHLRHLWPAVDVFEQDTVFHRQSGLYHDGDGPAHNRCCNVFPRRLRADGHVSAGLDKKAEGGKEAARLCQGSALMSADS